MTCLRRGLRGISMLVLQAGLCTCSADSRSAFEPASAPTWDGATNEPPTSRPAVALATGKGNTCALISGGAVGCWGHNDAGQLGNGALADYAVPVMVLNLSGALAIAAGGDHSCALLPGGTIECWGSNSYGELGNGTMAYSTVPIAVSNLSGATAVAAGDTNTCALSCDGGIDCWG